MLVVSHDISRSLSRIQPPPGGAGREKRRNRIMKRMTKGLLFLLTTVFTAALCALPASASSVGGGGPSRPALRRGRFRARRRSPVFHRRAMPLPLGWGQLRHAGRAGRRRPARGRCGRALRAQLQRRTLTRLTFPESGNAVPDEVRTLDSPALLDTAGALRPLRGCAVSGGWLYLLVESDVPLKTDLLALCLDDGRWEALEHQNIQAIAACGDGSVMMASYDIPGCGARL